MDWNFAIEKHREALRRILAMLVAMAGFPTLDAAGREATLPRRLRRALLALLRPAEAAARRLVIVAARGLAVVRRKVRSDAVTPHRAGGPATPPKTAAHALPLFDPLPRWKQRWVPHAGVPRISVPGLTTLFAIAEPREPSPDDSVGAARLLMRLHALADVLDDLPRHARRFARWRAAQARAWESRGAGPTRPRRIWPLRPGRPPGHHPRGNPRPAHAVHEVLSDLHGLAFSALNDTS